MRHERFDRNVSRNQHECRSKEEQCENFKSSVTSECRKNSHCAKSDYQPMEYGVIVFVSGFAGGDKRQCGEQNRRRQTMDETNYRRDHAECL